MKLFSEYEITNTQSFDIPWNLTAVCWLFYALCYCMFGLFSNLGTVFLEQGALLSNTYMYYHLWLYVLPELPLLWAMRAASGLARLGFFCKEFRPRVSSFFSEWCVIGDLAFGIFTDGVITSNSVLVSENEFTAFKFDSKEVMFLIVTVMSRFGHFLSWMRNTCMSWNQSSEWVH